jgi:geranylgeranyl pyrophosphate synthase
VKNSAVNMPEIVPSPVIINSDRWTNDAARERLASTGAAGYLPGPEEWPELLGARPGGAVEAILRRALIEPIEELTATPGKRIRAQLVTFSNRLLKGDQPPSVAAARRCRLAVDAIEFIHAGSLIVDDIEDGSAMRRGRPALHVRYGMPVALNAGNWLYFWPFDLLKELSLPKDQLLLVYDSCHRTLLRAHLGQALDLGAKVGTLPQAHVEEVCITSMRLKTGALMGFAGLLGGAVTGAPNSVLSILDDFGRDLGTALQMHDDLGNATGGCEPSKRYEDFTLARPSWVWACAAANSTRRAYQEFLTAVSRLPDRAGLEGWFSCYDIIERTRQSARNHLDSSFNTLKTRLETAGVDWSHRAFDELRDLGEEIAIAYDG